MRRSRNVWTSNACAGKHRTMRVTVVCVVAMAASGCVLSRAALGGATNEAGSVDAAMFVDAFSAIDADAARDPDAFVGDDTGVDGGTDAFVSPDGGTDAGRDAGMDAGPPCTPVAEACNLYDDDCDGHVDETACGGCEAREHAGHVYQLCPSATGFQAWGNCTTLGYGYDLIVLNDPAEADFLTSWTGAEQIDIGLNDFRVDGTFVWADGRPDDLHLWRTTGTPEPNGGTNENCVFTASGFWFDNGCANAGRYVCEGVALTSAPPAGTTETCNGRDDDRNGPIDEGVCPCATRVFDHHVYQTCTTGHHWDTAQGNCDANGYTMSVIDSLGEAQGVGSMIDGWIGLNDRAMENHFVYESAPSVEISIGNAAQGGHFVGWNAGEPNDSGIGAHTENCVTQASNGGWNDTDCNDTRNYTCERAIVP